MRITPPFPKRAPSIGQDLPIGKIPYGFSYEQKLYVGTFLLSLMLSVWTLFLDTTINNDGVLYLAVADRMASGDYAGAYHLYNWPFYSAIIAMVHKITSLEMETAAHLLDAFLVSLTTLFFIRLVKKLGGDQKIMLIAAIIILAHPSLNGYRSNIIRDHGFLAFFILSIELFINHFENPTLLKALLWEISLFIATLFRIEGIIFFTLVPTLFLFRSELLLKERLRWVIFSHPLAIVGTLCLILWVQWGAGDLENQSGRFYEPWLWLQRLTEQLTAGLAKKAAAIKKQVLTPYSQQYAMAGILSLIVIIFATTIVKKITLVYLGLAVHAHMTDAMPASAAKKSVLLTYIILHLLVLAVVVTTSFFLVGRFVLPLLLPILALTPFSIAFLYQRYPSFNNKHKFILALVACLLLINTVDGLDNQSNHLYPKVGAWLQQESAHKMRLYTNHPLVWYYAGKKNLLNEKLTRWTATEQFLKSYRWQNFDYLAIVINRNNAKMVEALTSLLPGEPKIRFNDKKEKEVWIYAVKDLMAQPASP